MRVIDALILAAGCAVQGALWVWRIYNPGLAETVALFGYSLVLAVYFLHAFDLLTSWGGLIFLAGLCCNAVVMIANGGYMPVPAPVEFGDSTMHEVMTDETALPMLADVLPYGFAAGDLLIGVGLGLALVTFLHRPEMAR